MTYSFFYTSVSSMLGKVKGFLHLVSGLQLLFAMCLLLINFCGPHITALLCPVPHCLLVMVTPLPVKFGNALSSSFIRKTSKEGSIKQMKEDIKQADKSTKPNETSKETPKETPTVKKPQQKKGKVCSLFC